MVSISSCPVMTNANKLLFCTVSFWTCLYCGNKNHNLHMPCFRIHSLALHLPPDRFPLQQSYLSSTVFQYPSECRLRIPALPATTTGVARLQEHSRPIQLLILLPHHRVTLSSCLFLCFSSFYNPPPTRGGFFVPFFLFPYLFLVGKPNTCLGAKFAGGKFQCSFTMWTFGWALLFPDFWRWSISQWWHFIANRH